MARETGFEPVGDILFEHTVFNALNNILHQSASNNKTENKVISFVY